VSALADYVQQVSVVRAAHKDALRTTLTEGIGQSQASQNVACADFH
jgi:hypothetical protein